MSSRLFLGGGRAVHQSQRGRRRLSRLVAVCLIVLGLLAIRQFGLNHVQSRAAVERPTMVHSQPFATAEAAAVAGIGSVERSSPSGPSATGNAPGGLHCIACLTPGVVTCCLAATLLMLTTVLRVRPRHRGWFRIRRHEPAGVVRPIRGLRSKPALALTELSICRT